MKSLIAILFLAVLALDQPSFGQTGSRPAPRLGFVQSDNSSGIVDLDALKAQGSSGNSAAGAGEAQHEALLLREFTDAYNQISQCDRVVLIGKGDNSPDFALRIEVGSHDTPGQKPVWNWVLRDVRKNLMMPAGKDDSAQQAAKSICTAVTNQAEQDRQRRK